MTVNMKRYRVLKKLQQVNETVRELALREGAGLVAEQCNEQETKIKKLMQLTAEGEGGQDQSAGGDT